MKLNRIFSKDGIYWLAYYTLIGIRADRIVPDKFFLELQYRCIMGKKLNLKSPQEFNEKIQWLKLYNRRPEYITMVDKYAVKDYVAAVIGSEYVIPTLGVWNRAEDIEWGLLPEKFVLKTTHDSGGVVICKNKSELDKDKARKKLDASLKRDYYKASREWPYKKVPHQIIAEEYLDSIADDGDLYDYKFFCFDGEVKMIEVDYNRAIHHNRNLYTPEWVRIDAEIGVPSELGREFTKPQNLEKAIEVAQKLSAKIPFVRIDLYIVGEKIYFGEITFFHASGYNRIKPECFSLKIGEWIHLPKIR